MKLKLYNTLTRQKEDFIPLMDDLNYKGPKKDFVGMYSCGPTVYYTPHIGNLRATFTADLIRNTLKLLGYKVKAVMNITDVGHLVSDGDEGEDKMEKGARREGKTAKEIAEQYEKIFRDNMKDLNIDEFDVMPKATEHIQKQIELIKTLEEKGYTYAVVGDGIYMDTSKVENYGELMGPNYKKRLADLNAGERVDMKGKKAPTDFALWKFSPEGEKRQMERESPWGIGFPGRHIECSAMSSEYLGEQFDIHHGGADHITIHHPNEIAQSECSCGIDKIREQEIKDGKKGRELTRWVNYWIHNEFLQVDGGKMSKSLGNVYSLEDIKAKGYSPLDLRYFYFMAQYGNFQNFTWDQLEAAKNSRESLINKIRNAEAHGVTESIISSDKILDTIEKFFITRKYIDFKDDNEDGCESIINDFFVKQIGFSFVDNGSSMFLTFFKNIIFSLLDSINTPGLIAEIHTELTHPSIGSKELVRHLDNNLLKLGLFEKKEVIEIPAEIVELAEQRKQAKIDKNYTLSDELRNKINSLGREIKDTKDGYEISKI